MPKHPTDDAEQANGTHLKDAYAPPRAEEPPLKKRKVGKPKKANKSVKRKPDYTLYSPLAIAILSVLFTPLFGSLLASANQRRLGSPEKARNALLLGFGVSVAVATVAIAFVDEIPDMAARGASMGASVGIALHWRREQQPLWEQHVAAGGAGASVLWPTMGGFGVVGGLVAIVLVVLVGASDPPEFQAGVEAFDAGNYEQAEESFRTVLAEQPAHHNARFNLALSLVRQRRAAEAIDELGQIPDSAEIYPQARDVRKELRSANDAAF